MFGGDRFEDLIGQISIGKCEPPLGGETLLVFLHLLFHCGAMNEIQSGTS